MRPTRLDSVTKQGVSRLYDRRSVRNAMRHDIRPCISKDKLPRQHFSWKEEEQPAVHLEG
jgi:hypothetical protein